MFAKKKRECILKRKVMDPDMFAKKHRKSDNRSKYKRKGEDMEIFRSKNRKSKAKSERKHKNDETKALKRFLDQTRFGPIFVCSCCYTRQFKESV